MHEFDFIERIEAEFGSSSEDAGVVVGIGDDCAILEKRFDLVTTDTLVEGVHFSFDYMTPEDVGYRTLAASLSDVAAMGGVPGAYFVNLSVSREAIDEVASRFYRGLKQAEESLLSGGWRRRILLAGGDTTRTTGPMVATVTLLGSSVGETPIQRSGARVGDLIVVTGTLGDAAAGLEIVQRGGKDAEGRFGWLVERHRRPDARAEFGIAMGKLGGDLVHAAIDCSDGLVQDLGHVAVRSGVGARVDVAALPRSAELAAYAEEGKAREWMLSGGEDFELILGVTEEGWMALQEIGEALSLRVSVVGRFVAGEGVKLELESEQLDWSEKRGGYQHF